MDLNIFINYLKIFSYEEKDFIEWERFVKIRWNDKSKKIEKSEMTKLQGGGIYEPVKVVVPVVTIYF